MKKLLTVLLGVCLYTSAFSQGVSTGTLQQYVSTNNAGTEFWFSFPQCYEDESMTDKSARIFVASRIAQTVTVEVPGKGFSETKMAVANDVIEFRIPLPIAQPYSKLTASKAPIEKVYERAGVHVFSESAPVVVYGVSRLNYTSDGFLAVPVSGLSTEYVIGAWPQYTATGGGFKLPSESNIVAAFDQTEVTFLMGGTSGSKTTGGLTAGQGRTWILNRGDVLCFANDDDGQDITGSLITADKPVAVVSGNQCANVPAGVYACDYICEMELGTNLWGKEYHVTPVANRLYNPIIRVFAHPSYRDVKVYRDGVEWLTIPNNIRTENEAFITQRVFEGAPRSTVITADAPIYIMLYNTGQTDDNVSSDPFQCVLTPLELYQKEIVFATPNAKGGTMPFERNYVNLVYALDENNEIPQDLEFGTLSNGQVQWQTLSTVFGTAIGQRFTVPSSNGENYAMKRLALAGDGVYRIRANKPFASYSYGFSNYDSYGFPTSASLLDLSINDTIPPTISETISRDTVFSGTITDPIVGGKRSAVASISQVKEYSTNTEFTYNAGKGLYPKNTQVITWNVKVLDKTKNARCVFVVADRAGNYSYKDYSYTAVDAGSLVLQVPNQILLNVSKEKSYNEKLTLKSSYKNTSFVIKDITNSDNDNFIINKESIIGKTINPNETLEIPIKFQPKTFGNYISKVTVITETDKTIDVTLEAKAIRNMITSTEAVNFDTSLVDQVNISDRNFVIQAGNDEYSADTRIVELQSVPANAISFKSNKFGSEGFQVNDETIINQQLLANKGSLVIPVKFKPVKNGEHSAMLQILGEGGSKTTVSLLGYGKTVSSVEGEPEVVLYSVYPNPAKKSFAVKGLSGKTKVSLVTLLGEVKIHTETENNELLLEISDISSGKYFVEIKDGHGVHQIPITIVE